MRISLLVSLLTIVALTNPALAVDHNNIDAGRPLSFDDAESVTDVASPTGSGSGGVDFRLRGIASKTVGEYDRSRLNLDLDLKTNPDTGDRSIIPGLILGYSRPIGYPERFDLTLVGEMGVLASQESDGGAVIRTGVGMRQNN